VGYLVIESSDANTQAKAEEIGLSYVPCG